MKYVGIILTILMGSLPLFSQTLVQEVWVKSFFSGQGFKQDLANHLVRDSQGNLFVAGHRVVDDSMAYMDIEVLKFDDEGNLLATAVINGSANKNDKVNSIVVDSEDNIIITGSLDNGDTGKDLLVVKFDNDLNEQWRVVYNGAGSYDDKGRDVTVDGAGNVYVTGYSMENTNPWVSPDAITMKIDPNGNVLWQAIYDGPDNQHDEGKAVTVDTSGNVYVAGYSKTASSGWDVLVLKYDANGNLLWAQRNGNAGGNNFAIDMVLRSNGVVVTGVSSQNGGDVLTLAYDSNGNKEWEALYNSEGSNEDQPFGIVLDAQGNIIIGATIEGAVFDSTRNYGILKYDANGNLLWADQYDGPANDWDDLNSVAVDDMNKIYVTGQSNGMGSGPDFATLRYEEDGNMMWEARYTSSGEKSDQAMDLVVDAEGNVFVVGTANLDSVAGITLIKYDQILAAPTLLMPENNKTQVELSPTLQWGEVTGASTYQVQVAKDDQFTDMVVDTQVTSATFQMDSLNYDTPYYWRVRAINYTGNGLWSETWSFRTKLPLPDQVMLVAPADMDTIQTDSVQFMWQASQPQVDGYQVQVATQSDFSTLVVDTTVMDTMLLVRNLTDKQTYFWRVRAHNISGWGEYSDTWQFSVEIHLPMPSMVQLASPQNGAILNADSVQLSWHPAQPEILHYLVEVATDSNFANLIVADSTVTDTSFLVTGLSDSTTYYWRVKAHNATGWGDYSEAWMFTIQLNAALALPDSVHLKSPEDGATVDSNSVRLVWYSQPGVDKYQIKVSTDLSLSPVVLDTVVTDTTFLLTGLQNNQTYYWIVRAHNAAGWGAYSDIWRFTLAITGITEGSQLPVVFALKQNYPNPFNPATTIEYQLPVRSFVRLEIFNAVGEKIATLVNGIQSAQIHRVQWVANVPTGIYFYKLTAVDVDDASHRFEQIRKMLLIK